MKVRSDRENMIGEEITENRLLIIKYKTSWDRSSTLDGMDKQTNQAFCIIFPFGSCFIGISINFEKAINACDFLFL